VLYSLAAAKQDIKSQSNKVGDIKPSNVFVNDDGKIKIANVLSWPRELPSFAKVVDQGGLNYDGYLAPEDFPLLQNNTLDNDANEQSEMYAIGATILSAGILDNLSNAYDYKNKTYEFATLTNKRRIWGDSDKYSDIFKSIVLNLTSINPAERLTIN
jgi:serine/threonine protein kinase